MMQRTWRENVSERLVATRLRTFTHSWEKFATVPYNYTIFIIHLKHLEHLTFVCTNVTCVAVVLHDPSFIERPIPYARKVFELLSASQPACVRSNGNRNGSRVGVTSWKQLFASTLASSCHVISAKSRKTGCWICLHVALLGPCRFAERSATPRSIAPLSA